MSVPDLSSTPRTALGRHRERGRTERDDLYAVLDAGLICHLGVKIRAGGPSDEPEDYALDIWAGVVPVTSGFGESEPDAVLRTGIETLPHIVKRGELPQLGSAARLARHGRRGHRL